MQVKHFAHGRRWQATLSTSAKLVDGCCGRRCLVQNISISICFFLDRRLYCDIRIVDSAAAVAVYCFAEASRCLPQIIAASFFSLCGHLIGPVPLDGWCSRWIHEISDIKPSSCLAKILMQENKDFFSFVFVKCTCDALLLSSVSTGTSGDESVSSSYKQTAHTV